jgi:hypothetical protein
LNVNVGIIKGVTIKCSVSVHRPMPPLTIIHYNTAQGREQR